MTTDRACPVVKRRIDGVAHILAFRHPLAGNQIIKGRIESDEGVAQAALRELREESGVIARADRHLGSVAMSPDEKWHFILCRTDALPDEWSFQTEDDGGHEFQFFWHPLSTVPPSDWDPPFRAALRFLRLSLSRPVY